jgi:DNA-binding transcriptional LysR family regulator
MNANLDWEDLALVLALSRGAGLQQAADALGVHHSTAFRRLQRAEEHAGLALFHRLGGEYAPTETGQVIAEHAARVEDELLGVQRALESREGVPRGRVRLTTVPSLVASILPALTRLSEQCPELTLELDATPDTRALERGDADLALRPTAEPPPELVGTRLSVMGWATYRRRAGRRKDERLLYAGRLAERDQSTPVAARVPPSPSPPTRPWPSASRPASARGACPASWATRTRSSRAWVPWRRRPSGSGS